MKRSMGTNRMAGILVCMTAAVMLTAGCSTQVGAPAATETAAPQEASDQNDAAAQETAAAQEKDETEGLQKEEPEAAGEIVYHPLELTPEEEAAWKQEPAYAQTVKIGYNGGLCLGAFGIAQEMGFYEAEGLETEIVKMTGQTDALGTGKVDVSGDHIATLLVPAVNGVNMTFTTGCHTGCKTLYTLADSEIETTSDLVGKTVAIADGIGASDHNITLRFLNHDGIAPNEVNFKVVSNDAVILALQNGEIQAATLSDQFARSFLDDGTLRPVRSLTFDDDFSQEPCCIHAINTDFLEENPITSKKLTHAHQEASNWIQEHKEEFVDTMLEMNWASGDREAVLAFAETLDFTISDELTGIALENIINDYKGFGLISRDQDTEQLMERVWKQLLP